MDNAARFEEFELHFVANHAMVNETLIILQFAAGASQHVIGQSLIGEVSS